MYGKIDRVDIARDGDKRYLRIIDYKSSNYDINLNDVAYGLQLQLLTYLDAVCRFEDIEPAAVLYFNLIEERLDKRKTIDEIEEDIKKNFRMKGLLVADVKLIRMMDKGLESGSSNVVPAYITTKEEISDAKSRVATREQFKALQKYIAKTIKDISKEIFSGNIDIKPFYRGGRTGCDLCNYRGICQFDKNKFCNSYNFMPSLKKEEAWDKIESEE